MDYVYAFKRPSNNVISAQFRYLGIVLQVLPPEASIDSGEQRYLVMTLYSDYRAMREENMLRTISYDYSKLVKNFASNPNPDTLNQLTTYHRFPQTDNAGLFLRCPESLLKKVTTFEEAMDDMERTAKLIPKKDISLFFDAKLPTPIFDTMPSFVHPFDM